MTNDDPGNSVQKVCDLGYLIELMGGKKLLIKEIIDVFLLQVPIELLAIKNAILKTDYAVIRDFAHTMKSSVAIMGISTLKVILQEMETLGSAASGIEKIKELNGKLNLICARAMEEMEKEKLNYI